MNIDLVRLQTEYSMYDILDLHEILDSKAAVAIIEEQKRKHEAGS